MAMDDIQKHIQESMTDTEFQEAWKETEPEYELTRQIIALRLRKGLTQRELAHRIGTTQSVIARIENGGQNLSIRTLTKIANELDADVKIELLPC
jgi:DNA-binding XRE family transcriptional regulator